MGASAMSASSLSASSLGASSTGASLSSATSSASTAAAAAGQTAVEAGDIVDMAVAGARSLVLLMALHRGATFVLNQLLLRFTDPAVFGAASIQLEILLGASLFVAREGMRLALLRGRAVAASDAGGRHDTVARQVNHAWLALPATVVTAAAMAALYLWDTEVRLRGRREGRGGVEGCGDEGKGGAAQKAAGKKGRKGWRASGLAGGLARATTRPWPVILRCCESALRHPPLPRARAPSSPAAASPRSVIPRCREPALRHPSLRGCTRHPSLRGCSRHPSLRARAQSVLAAGFSCALPLSCALATQKLHEVPGFRTAVVLYAVAAVLESVFEPVYALTQHQFLVSVRVLVESAALVVRCVVTFYLVVYRDMGVVAFGVAQVVYSLTLIAGYFGYVAAGFARGKPALGLHHPAELLPHRLHGPPAYAADPPIQGLNPRFIAYAGSAAASLAASTGMGRCSRLRARSPSSRCSSTCSPRATAWCSPSSCRSLTRASTPSSTTMVRENERGNG